MDESERRPARKPLTVRSRARLDRLRRDPVAYALVEHFARQRRIALGNLLQGTRGDGHAALARQIAMYLVHVLLGRPQEVVGHLFSRERSTVSHACAIIEALRDENPMLELELAQIEAEGWAIFAVLEVRDAA